MLKRNLILHVLLKRIFIQNQAFLIKKKIIILKAPFIIRKMKESSILSTRILKFEAILIL